MARELGLGIYALSSGAAFDFDADTKDDMLAFGYSSLTKLQIEAAIGKLRSVLEDADTLGARARRAGRQDIE